ncbi:G5 domain-containing protein [Micromonospora sp. WMMD967]|uniref:G5 domain-containing protein n=1 Tax=Micromonospora sp. WMMD967 TaxID=3016101 RepID=UPI002416FE19|nr:G5 domain-containing protein [Micromonospora sp. WMMD967]MDG4836830.1 G5 domain-containing protein [Micromonospora sp. WMMD967]
MQPPQNPGPPYPLPFGQAPRPNWFRRASPARRTAVILGSVTLSILLLCCTGTAIIGALAGEPEPTKTGTAAEQAQQPIVAAPADPTEESPARVTEPVATPTAAPDAVAPPATASPTPSAAATVPVVKVTTETEQATVRYAEKTVKDASLAEGKRVVRTKGVNGVRTLTYEVTTTNGVRTSKKLVKSTVTKQPVTQVVAVGTKKPQSSNCDPNYSGCVPIASDVDCLPGTGDGPGYVRGPVKVIGKDIYRLDNDKDGYGCD